MPTPKGGEGWLGGAKREMQSTHFPQAYRKSGKSEPAATDSGWALIAFCSATLNAGSTPVTFGAPE